MTVSEAFDKIRETGVDKETIYTCYVLSRFNRILGLVSAKDLMLAKDQSVTVETLMTTNVITVSTLMDQEEVAKQLSKYNFLALPVVDRDNRMVGIITFDDAMDVMEEEATEDITIMSAQTPYEKSYLRTSPWELFKHRVPWLMLLMISATFTGLIITSFENALAQLVILTAFIPMLMDTGGNCGSQASTLVIRGMAVGEIELGNWFSVLWREFRVGVLVAIALTTVNFIRMRYFSAVKYADAAQEGKVELIVTISLFCTIICAKLIGCTLPMAAKRLHADPALMASPMLTTIVDALSLTIYFTIAGALITFTPVA